MCADREPAPSQRARVGERGCGGKQEKEEGLLHRLRPFQFLTNRLQLGDDFLFVVESSGNLAMKTIL
jgi:hypothetical protein